MSEEKRRIEKLEREIALLKRTTRQSDTKAPSSNAGAVALIISVVVLIIVGFLVIPPFIAGFQEAQRQRDRDAYLARRRYISDECSKFPEGSAEKQNCVDEYDRQHTSPMHPVVLIGGLIALGSIRKQKRRNDT